MSLLKWPVAHTRGGGECSDNRGQDGDDDVQNAFPSFLFHKLLSLKFSVVCVVVDCVVNAVGI